MNFEGLSNQDNFDIFGFRVNPPSPSGDVGPNHYVEMVKLAFAVYNKQGSRLLGPVPIGALWEGFAVEDCRDPTGDPIVLYDQFSDRWLLSQFTVGIPTRYSCVAVSQTGDPTGAYYRYAFTSGEFLPGYPKYGVWPGMYLLTTLDLDPRWNMASASTPWRKARCWSAILPPGRCSSSWIWRSSHCT